jgi:type IV pilus assembly protein PilM
MSPSLNLSFGRRSETGAVGLDVQPGFVAAVQARSNGALSAERAVALPLASDAVHEGDVVDVVELTDTLRKLFQGARLDKRVRVGVANQRTVMRTLELPPMSDAKELAAAVRFQAQDQVPMPLAHAVLDFHPVGVVDTPAGARQKVVLVAAQRDMVERLLTAVRGAGLTPIGVDLSAFALIRSLYRGDADHSGRVLYLNVDGLTNVAIAEASVCHFTRVLGGGIEEMVAELAERRGIPTEQARDLLADVDLTAGPREAAPEATVEDRASGEPGQASAADPAELERPEGFTFAPAAEAGEGVSEPEHPEAHEVAEPAGQPEMFSEELVPVDGPSASEEARVVLENGVRAIASEVRNSLDFHRSQEGGADVARVVLSGAALELKGFAETLQSSLGVQVDPQTVGVADGGVLSGTSAHRLAVATGLSRAEVPK